MVSSTATTPPAPTHPIPSIRRNGKNWHSPRRPFQRTTTTTTSSSGSKAAPSKAFAARAARRPIDASIKTQERRLKAEKEEERQRRIRAIKDKRAAKEERVRFEEMAARMHQRRVERVRRRERRNTLIRSGK